MAKVLQHPPDAELLAFNQGELEETALHAMSLHLDDCPGCCDRLRELGSSAGILTWLRRTAQQGSDGAATMDDTEAMRDFSAKDVHEWTHFLAPPQQPDEIGRLGNYRVLKVLGAGGMGIVYQAEDPDLERLVAVKAMLPAIAADASAKKRFLREAKAAAAVNHRHIVSIFQVGEDRGVPFLAMEFLEGEPLDVRLKRETILPLAETLRIGRELAEGLAAAHDRGLIHRDIKPANTWLMGTKAQVKILDFGLARSTNDDAHLTQSGVILGTPAYMSPEQGRGAPADARSDLWSLGVVLYRMCTGVMPFKGPDAVSTMLAVAMDEPPPPAQLNKAVPAKLSDLVMKLLEKDRDKRIPSAQEVVAALRELEQSKPGPNQRPVERTRSPSSRNEKITASAPKRVAGAAPARAFSVKAILGAGLVAGLAGVVVLAGLGVLTAYLAFRGEGSKGAVVDNRDKPKHNDGQPKELPPTGVATKADKPLPTVPPKAIEVPRFLDRDGTFNGCIPSGYSPDGKWLVTLGGADKVRVWDIATGDTIDTLPCNGSISPPVFSPDGSLLAVFGQKLDDGAVCLWDTKTFRQPRVLPGRTGEHQSVSFRADGKVLALGGSKKVVLWDLVKGQALDRLTGFKGDVAGVAFHPDGKRLATTEFSGSFIHARGYWTTDCEMGLWDVDPKSPSSKQKLHHWDAPDTCFRFGLDFTPPGDRLLFSRGPRGANHFAIADAVAGTEVARLPAIGPNTANRVVGWLPDKKSLLISEDCLDDRTIVIGCWDLAPSKLRHSFAIPTPGSHYRACVDPTGKTLVVGGKGTQRLHFYDVESGLELMPGTVVTKAKPSLPKPIDFPTGQAIEVPLILDPQGRPNGCIPACYSPDGKSLVTVGEGDKVRVWNVATGATIASLPSRGSLIHPFFSPDGAFLVVFGSGLGDGTLCLWDTKTFQQPIVLKPSQGPVLSAAFSADSKVLAFGDHANVVLWDRHKGQELYRLTSLQGNVAGLTFHPDGKWLATAVVLKTYKHKRDHWTTDCGIGLWCLDPESPLFKKQRHGWLADDNGYNYSLFFANAGERLYFSRGPFVANRFVGVDTKSGAESAVLASGTCWSNHLIGWLPDQKTLLTKELQAQGFDVVVVWNAATNQVVRRFPVPSMGTHTRHVIDPAGKTLAVGGQKTQRLRFYDVETGKEANGGTGIGSQ